MTLGIALCTTVIGTGLAYGPQPNADPFEVPLPQLGDRGTYVWHRNGVTDAVGWMDFEWTGETLVPGMDGLPVRVEEVVASGVLEEKDPAGGAFWQEPLVSSFYFGNHSMAGFEDRSTLVNSGRIHDRPAGYEIKDGVFENPILSNQFYFGPKGPHCLLRTPWQGQPLTNAAWPDTPCQLADTYSFNGAQFEWSQAVEPRLFGLDAIRIDGRAMEESVSFWLADGIPFPLRITWEGTDPGWVELAGFVRGTIESTILDRVPYSAPDRASPTPLELAPRTPSFFDDRGVQHPLTISEALQVARADPEGGKFRKFLGEEPDAYVYFATEHVWGDNRYWEIKLRGYRNSFSLIVQSGAPDIASPWLSLPRTGFGEAPYVLGPNGDHPIPTGTVEPSAVPNDVATARSLLEEASQSFPDEVRPAHFGLQEIPTWGFAIQCGGPDNLLFRYIGVTYHDSTATCDTPSLITWAGLRGDNTASKIASDSNATNWSQSMLVKVNGMPLLRSHYTSNWNQGESPPLNAKFVGSHDVPTPRPGAQASVRLTAEEARNVGIAGLFLALAYWFWPTFKGFVGAFFSRIGADDVAKQPARAALLEIIAANPGIRFRELARRTGFGNGKLLHHLHKLEDAGLVLASRSAKFVAYSPPGDRPDVTRIKALKASGARRLADAIARRPGLTLTEAAQECDLHVSTVLYHLRRLASANLAMVVRSGRQVRISPGPELDAT